MKLEKFNRETGAVEGVLDVPPMIIAAAQMLETWMREHEVSRLGGLMLFSNRQYPDEAPPNG